MQISNRILSTYRLMLNRARSWCFIPLVSILFVNPVLAENEFDAALTDFLHIQTQGLPGKVSFRIEPLDPNTQLSPCQAFQPFLPHGAKLWGKSTVGVRCLGPSNWTIYVQVEVSVSGNYLISARTMPAGYTIGERDIVVRSGDLSKLPPNIITEKSRAIGQTVKFGIAAGQPLRDDRLKAPFAVQQGQTVKTVSNGPGFSVSSEGKALNNAVAGQIVQVRTSNGQTVNGIARTGGIVEITH